MVIQSQVVSPKAIYMQATFHELNTLHVKREGWKSLSYINILRNFQGYSQ